MQTNSLAARISCFFIRVYRYAISPMLGPRCRFHPTCSEYALEALQEYGFLKGSYLSVRRILRCHPWHPGGIDHVPQKHTSNQSE